jgi:uncharacterized protein YdaU (DUF1376 family)
MKSPAFQMYAADIYMDTNEWSAEAVGIYTRLLFHQWVNGSIPKDIKKLSQIALVSIKILSKRWPEIESKFIFDESLRGRNIRLEETRQKQIQYSEIQREKGIKRSKKMWEGHIATAIPTAILRLQPDVLPKDSSLSSTSSSKNIKKGNGLFLTPKIEDVREYCRTRQNSVDPAKWHDYYSSNGWKVGKNPMKDWQAAVRTWEKSEFNAPKKESW